jgi:hypothetical protein
MPLNMGSDHQSRCGSRPHHLNRSDEHAPRDETGKRETAQAEHRQRERRSDHRQGVDVPNVPVDARCAGLGVPLLGEGLEVDLVVCPVALAGVLAPGGKGSGFGVRVAGVRRRGPLVEVGDPGAGQGGVAAEPVCKLFASVAAAWLPAGAAGVCAPARDDPQRRCGPVAHGCLSLRTIAALLTLRDQVIAPILAAVRSPRMGRKPAHWTRVDRDYERIRIDMQTLFNDLAIDTPLAA